MTIECLLDDGRGIYIPQYFAQNMTLDLLSGVDDDVWPILRSGPEHESYWDAWDEVLLSAVVTKTGETFYQDGDLFIVSKDHVWEDDEA